MDVWQHYPIFNKKINQHFDRSIIEKIKYDVAECITHVLDCECYNVNQQWYLREVSLFDLKEDCVFTYQIYHSKKIPYSKTVAYQIKHIHGLPVINSKITTDFFTSDEVLRFLKQHFCNSNVLVGYKGGVIEYNILSEMSVRSINIEVLGCPKYEKLLLNYSIEHQCCRYHKSHTFHCSAHEVKIFARFIKEISNGKR